MRPKAHGPVGFQPLANARHDTDHIELSFAQALPHTTQLSVQAVGANASTGRMVVF